MRGINGEEEIETQKVEELATKTSTTQDCCCFIYVVEVGDASLNGPSWGSVTPDYAKHVSRDISHIDVFSNLDPIPSNFSGEEGNNTLKTISMSPVRQTTVGYAFLKLCA